MLKRPSLFVFVPAGLLLGGVFALGSCSNDGASVVVKPIVSRADLIGGPGALGDVGDWLLANEQIRLIIQSKEFSRGFGIYGGSLVDADLQRPATFGDSSGGKGRDNFSELFPGLFLKAMKPSRVEGVRNDDGSASVVVSGRAADFVFLAQKINDVLIETQNLLFRNEYRLQPGKRYVEITTTITNGGESAVDIPADGISSLLGDATFVFPVGDVILFGAGNDVFAEGAGFDLRFTLEESYKQPISLPQLPGLVTPWLATRGKGVSYGFMSGITDPERSLVTKLGYEGAAVTDMLVPFLASSFTGTYYGAAPEVLGSRESFSFKKYFMVGSGDIASIRDVVHEIRGTPTGLVSGFARDRITQAPEVGVDVLTFDTNGRAINQHTTDSNGQFRGTYPPGEYTYRVVSEGRFPTRPEPFTVEVGGQTFLEIELVPVGEVSVRVVGEDGRLLPARCSIVGTYPASAAGFEGREFLYDLKLGERWRPLDLVQDSTDPLTRRYVEEVIIAPLGEAKYKVRPGKYAAVCSRGMEYDVFTQQIEVRPRELARVDALLKRVVDTRGWASGDFHLHAINSVDSSFPLDDRVATVAAEGVDIAVSTDHNFVTDYSRSISSQGLEQWVQGMVGLEMSPIEIGHFNGYPLRYDAEPIAKGSFEWSGRPPQDLFDDLRALGKYGPENTIVQVNHPRDTILGYFNDYNLDPDSGEPRDSDSLLLSPEGPEFGADKFSWDFDALEIYNGKRFDLLRHYRVPEKLPPPPLPEVIPPAGTVLRDEDGEIAYPGGMDDWFTMLTNGRIVTAMGNSDTHGLDDEPGAPRTYVPVSNDLPGAIDELEVVAAIKNQRAFPTNGPFSRVRVTGDGGCFDRRTKAPLTRAACEMGDVVATRTGRVTVEVDTQVADWVKINRVVVSLNGEVAATVRGDNESLQKVTQEVEVSGDGFITVEIAGDESMFPVLVPREVPSIQVSDALGSIGSAFGFDLSPFGNLQPSQVTITFPYAFTNPVFVDTTGDGVYDPPGTSSRALRATGPCSSAKKPDRTGLPVLAKLFAGFAGCGHTH